MSLNDEAWELIFQKGSLLKKIKNEGYVYITPNELKELGDKREPRLLAKQDTSNLRPKIFRDNNLSILPIRNDKYIIFIDKHTKTYYNLENLYENTNIEEYSSHYKEWNFAGINPLKLSSESKAIDYAFIVSLIKTFTNEKELFLTIRGRQRSENFNIDIPDIINPIQVSGVQIEVDAGYESFKKIYIIEAKNNRINDFNIRQLYYPFKNLLALTNKEIIPIFFIYTNDLFYFIQIKFGSEYGDIKIVKSKCYTIDGPYKQHINLKSLIEFTIIEIEPNFVPFPQANDIDRIIDLVRYFNKKLKNSQLISDYFEIDERQGDYYANAAIYLGLLKRKDNSNEFELTTDGIQFSTKKRKERNLHILSLMLKRPIFNYIIYNKFINQVNEKKSNNWIAEVIIKNTGKKLNETTADRRASTAKSWMNWIENNFIIK